MAIIYTYPQINSSSDLAASDLMIISDMSANGRPTKSLTLKNLADFITTTGTGTGTTNAIIKWTDGPSGLLGDSIMNEDVDKINLNGILRIAESNNRRLEIKYGSDNDTSHVNNAPQSNQIIGRAGDLIIKNRARTRDILFQADDGQYDGNVTTYFRLDGSMADLSNPDLYTRWGDNSRIVLGNSTNANSLDFEMYHDGSATYMKNGSFNLNIESKGGIYIENKSGSGDIDITQSVTNADINIIAYNGNYLRVDTSAGATIFSKPVQVPLVPTVNANAASKQYVDQQIASIPAGLVFQGNWNASTNTPTLASGTGTVGNYYVVSVAGNTNLDGITDWEVGDWAVFVEVGGVDKWDKIDQTFVQGAGAIGQVSFWNGVNSVTGSNNLFYDSSNIRLGIGTNTPSQKLTVEGNIELGTGGYVYGNSTSEYLRLNTAAGSTLGYTTGFITLGPTLTYNTASGEVFRINHSNGNVGIGTTSPDKKLDITVDTSDDGVILQTVSGRKSLEALVDNGTNGQGKIHFYTGADLLHGRIMADSAGLNITQLAADKDIIFQADNGSGGIETYFFLDGSAGGPLPFTVFPDNSTLTFGTGYDLRQYHNGTDSYLDNYEGNLNIRNYANDKDIVFQCDNGSGGLATYFRLDGSQADGTYRYIDFPDNSVISLGDNDAAIFHDGTDTRIKNETGDLFISQFANDKDIIFRSDNGGGGVTEYFKLDGTNKRTKFSEDILITDNKKVRLGSGSDFEIYHDSSNSRIENNTGHLYIRNDANNSDIIFQTDDGGGGVATYFFLDGSSVTTQFYKTIKLYDAAFLYIGDSNDLQFYHNGTNSTIQNFTGNLTIRNDQNDGDIELACDDGSGGVTPYFTLDGSDGNVKVYKQFGFLDNVKATFGNSGDLQIYHTGSSSIIGEFGPGNLSVRGDNLQLHRADGSQRYFQGITGGAATMYHAGNPKIETTSTGTKTTGQMDLAALNTAVTNSDDNGNVGEIRFTADYIYVCVADDTWKRVALSTW